VEQPEPSSRKASRQLFHCSMHIYVYYSCFELEYVYISDGTVEQEHEYHCLRTPVRRSLRASRLFLLCSISVPPQWNNGTVLRGSRRQPCSTGHMSHRQGKVHAGVQNKNRKESLSEALEPPVAINVARYLCKLNGDPKEPAGDPSSRPWVSSGY